MTPVENSDCPILLQNETYETLSKEETQFLTMVHDPIRRQFLLARLEQLGLLSAFLEAENGKI